MVVLANYCTEVYFVLTYKSVKSVIEVSRCKFTVCIVILYLSPRELPIIVLKMKFDNQKMRKAARDLSDDRQKNIEIISQCENFLAPQHWTQIHFKFCHVWIFPHPRLLTQSLQKKTPPDNLGRRVTHSNFRLFNFCYLSEPFQQRPANYNTRARTLVTGAATSSPILASFTRSTFANFAHQIPIKL